MRYLFKKLFALFLFKISFLNVYNGNIYFRNKVFLKKKFKILFLLNDTDFIHLGDSLFFDPIISLFNKQNFNVEVKCNKSMEFYYQHNYKILLDNNINYNDYNLVITNRDFIIKTFFKKNIVYINFNYYKSKKRIINHNIESLINLFELNTSYIDVPFYPNITNENLILKKFNLLKDRNYIIFSNYIDSGSFRLDKSKKNKLLLYLYDFMKNNNYLVIHIGTLKDKLEDNTNYKKIIDLRGKTSVRDLFDLCSLKNIDIYIGFDNFLMHLFFLKNKKLKIMSRGKPTNEGNIFLKNCIDPPYESCNFNKEYI